MFTVFLFLIVLIPCLYFVYTTKQKSDNLKKQVILLTKQNNYIHNFKNDKVKNESISIRYESPKYKNGIIIKDCSLYIAPLEDYPQIYKLQENTKVDIHDSAQINSEIWYEISIPYTSKINTKGWIKEDFISVIENEHINENE
ncbi:hypothetical protein ACFIJ5_01390 [Haloimpatiens sp. FM7330]|uniref:hypothetical protein n=1 Tax=Haloimpatiens sp. FM7330 TaxID=3298610 RepID=UPI00363D5076